MSVEKTHKYSRRQLLRRGGLALSGLGLLAPLLSTNGCGTAQAAVVAPKAKEIGPSWKALRKDLSGNLIQPSDKHFLKLAVPKNLRFAEQLPSGIARCRNVQDVQNALDWAQTNHIPLVIRSGGYSGAGYSTTPGLLLDLSLMNSVHFEENTNLVTVGGGTSQSDLTSELRKKNVALTHGNCAGLGIGGLVLGGGMGFDMRRHGLLCDQLVKTEVITADGQIQVGSREQNQDLFWACRGGGGGNFGVNTSFTFQTFPVDPVTVFKLEWSTDLDVLLPTLLSLLPKTPDRLGVTLRIDAIQGAPLTLSLQGQLVGTREELFDILEVAYQLSYPKVESVEDLPYWEAQDRFAEVGASGYSQERSHYSYSEMPLGATDSILDSLRRWPRTSGSATWQAFLTGGAVDRVQRRATAYVHRGAHFLNSLKLSWNVDDKQETVEKSLEWMDRFHLAMVPFTSGESYQNFIDPSQEHYLNSYYGENLTYLVAMKQRYDPSNVFRFPQSLPTSLDVG